MTEHVIRYGRRDLRVDLSAADLRELAAELDAKGVPDTAEVRARTRFGGQLTEVTVTWREGFKDLAAQTGRGTSAARKAGTP